MFTERSDGVEVTPPQRGVAWRVGRFLDSHPADPLTIIVRSLTIKGLAWLGPQCRDRPVRIVIGRWRPPQFSKAAAADRTKAVALLSRTDVVIRAWDPEREPPVLVNARAWVAHTEDGPSVLLCSADLTYKGLHANWEVAASVADGDRRQVADQIAAIATQAEDCKDTLLPLVAGVDYRQGGTGPPAARPTTSGTPTRPAGGVAERIEAFLDAYPRRSVTVAVGYASVSGLVWLSERVARPPNTTDPEHPSNPANTYPSATAHGSPKPASHRRSDQWAIRMINAAAESVIATLKKELVNRSDYHIPTGPTRHPDTQNS